MTHEQYLLFFALWVIAAPLLFHSLQAVIRTWKYHGQMLVTCPENQKHAAVRVATFRAALTEFFNIGRTQLSRCSRWPERRDCDQNCLCQIERHPEDHRVWNIASQWFTGERCAYCKKLIAPLSHLDHAPALLNLADGRTVEWRNLSAEQLPEAFSDCMPVCWNCHITETFLRKFPGRAVMRPWRH